MGGYRSARFPRLRRADFRLMRGKVGHVEPSSNAVRCRWAIVGRSLRRIIAVGFLWQSVAPALVGLATGKNYATILYGFHL